jgi:hypothetical protein
VSVSGDGGYDEVVDDFMQAGSRDAVAAVVEGPVLKCPRAGCSYLGLSCLVTAARSLTASGWGETRVLA